MRPGREHDTTAVCIHTEILPALAAASTNLRSFGDLGYEGESAIITVAFKKPKGRTVNRCSSSSTTHTTASARPRTRQRPAMKLQPLRPARAAFAASASASPASTKR